MPAPSCCAPRSRPARALDRGILATHLAADGGHYRDLYVDGGPSSTGTTGHVRMNGREVFRCAVGELADAALTVLDRAGFGPGDLDWLVPHQANRRIIDAVGKRLQLPADKVIVTVERHANTSAASIPLALERGRRGRPHPSGRPGRGDRDGRRVRLGRGTHPLVMRRATAERLDTNRCRA